MPDNPENQATQIIESSPFPGSPLTEYPPSPSLSTVNPQETLINRRIEPQVLQGLLKERDVEESQSNLDSAEDMEMLGMYFYVF